MVNHGFNLFSLGMGSSTQSIFGKCLMLVYGNEKIVFICPYFLMCDEYQKTVNKDIYGLGCRGLIADGCPVAKVV